MNRVIGYTLAVLFLGVSIFGQHCLLARDVMKELETHEVMTLGGDDRLHLFSKTNKNKYHTSSIALSDDMIARSSCTSSRPTKNAFAAADVVKHKLAQADEQTFINTANQTRQRIKKAFCPSLASNVHAICTPSGSDAEMIFSLIALARHEGWNKASSEKTFVTNIVVTAGEVGSGTARAAGGKHFSDYTPLSDMVRAGESIKGISEQDINVVELVTRDEKTGIVIPKNVLEVNIEQLLADVVAKKGHVAVLHMVHCSKTGVGTPSIAFLHKMQERYGNKLIIVIDAAQGRFADDAVTNYLQDGMCVLLTGSKFFTGAPFSGVTLIPDVQAQELKSGLSFIPEGLGGYFSAYDVDDSLSALKGLLPAITNSGLILRWETGLYEIERFYSFPQEHRNDVVAQWVSAVQNLMKQYTTFVRLEDVISDMCMAESYTVLGGRNTVVSFVVCRPNHEWFTVSELKEVHKFMAQDVSSMLPQDATQQERVDAARICLIGQPVKIIGDRGVLRVALSAPMVSDALEQLDKGVSLPAAIAGQLQEDKVVFDKLSLIIRYFDELTKTQ